ncbi:MAG TPA: carbamoyl-phosphate synthase large subunit [Thermoanaerobaculia bacterium]|nr:carbamoyl-phosphate synthase large subunit [Thermoanaerobaculia bacterium]
MPKRTDIHSILVIGSGPIIIGQAGEFDYSGTQACKALKEEGFEIILVNSNPATIMTDPDFAHRTYIEPLTHATLERIIERDRPDAILPTVGGQTAINLAMALYESGTLERYGVKLIGANYEAIRKAEDRQLFKEAMNRIGVEVARSGYAGSLDEALEMATSIGYPIAVRPSFTLGGTGGGIAFNVEELRAIVARGLDLSPVGKVLIEESLIGWKEFELELMRDIADNVIVVCSIENFDPMGVHTGDSITVAPQQTLSNAAYQAMRDDAKKIIREIGVETGGSNIQFAVDPATGRRLAIEMNPRVSRSSALSSKATGFPIAKFAAKLAAGYTLDEIPNDITKKTPASFEPTLDYVVVKIPRFSFEKFRKSPQLLGFAMQSVGEVMAIGRTFNEALQKGLRSLEIGVSGLDDRGVRDPSKLRELLRSGSPSRIFAVGDAFRSGMSVEEVYEVSSIDTWFLHHIHELIAIERRLAETDASVAVRPENLRRLKEKGLSDRTIAQLTGKSEDEIRKARHDAAIRPVFKRVDTCAAEFSASTPYLYSTYDTENEADPTNGKKVIILGSGPNRIGQGVEFDTCCVHAAFALRELGFETIMVNCNPETVSTDYDTSDRLYFEPLTLEDVLEIIDLEKPTGVILQFGGQTPLKLARDLARAGVPLWGTSTDSIDLAEDRERFGRLLGDIGIRAPEHGNANTEDEAREIAERIGYPIVVRPSYVLGGRAMGIVYDSETLGDFITDALEAGPGHPVLIDRFLENALEIDVDAVSDGATVVIAGIMQHIEEAGIHSGDSTSVIPPYLLTQRDQDRIRRKTVQLAKALQVVGLMNIQFAIADDEIYVLEVNPRASRTVPYVSKATGIPFAKVAARIMAGVSLAEQGITTEPKVERYYVKAPVFPFSKFPLEDTVLGPEMKSTGEVMGSSMTFGEAYVKALLGAGIKLPMTGTAFISINEMDKRDHTLRIARALIGLGFDLLATKGTRSFLAGYGISSGAVLKIHEGRPNIVDRMINGEIALIINTPLGRSAFYDDAYIRKYALQYHIPCVTTLSAATACVDGIRESQSGGGPLTTLQEQHGMTLVR